MIFNTQQIHHRFDARSHLSIRGLTAAIFIIAGLFASPATAEKSGKISLKVTALERMKQYPPPPPPQKVFVVTAGNGHEMAVITVKVTGSTAFEDYKLSADASVVDADGAKHTAVLSKPFKSGVSPEVWDKQVMVFSIKKDIKLKTLSVAGMTFDLSNVEENK